MSTSMSCDLVDDVAYIASGRHGIVVLDVLNPEKPIQLAYFRDVPGLVKQIRVWKQLMYVTCRRGGLRIYMRNRSHITEIGALTHPKYPAKYISINKHSVAFVTFGLGGLCTIDIADPTNPTELGSYNYGKHEAGCVIVYNSEWAFVAFHEAGIRILDVSTPSNPIEMGSYHYEGYKPYDFSIHNHVLYVAYGFGGILALDIANPSHPVLIASHRSVQYACPVRQLTIQDSILYLSTDHGGVRVLDTSPDLNELGSYNSQHCDVKAVAITVDRFALALLRSGAVRILDIQNPKRILQIARVIPKSSSLPWGAWCSPSFVLSSCLANHESVLRNVTRGGSQLQ